MLKYYKRIIALFMFAILAVFPACQGSGDGETNSDISTADSSSLLVSGVYTLDLDVGLIVCGDGTQYSQGFGASVVMYVDSPFLAFFRDGTRIGTGDVDADGVFHANVTVTEATAEYVITLDGQAGEGQVTGAAKAIVIPVIGTRCALNTTFTATPGGDA